MKAALDAIEKAWRTEHSSLRGLVFKGAERGIVPESTWHDWKAGNTEPPYSEIVRIFGAVREDVGPSVYDGIDAGHGVGVRTGVEGSLKKETTRLIGIMEKGSDELREAIMDAVDGVLTERASNPQRPGEEQGSPSTRHK